MLEEPIPLGQTPLPEVNVAPGYYRIVVEQPGVGFCEMTRYLDQPGRHYAFVARLLETKVTRSGMVRIEAGSFVFGDPNPGIDPFLARREETLSAFWIDEHEVSQAQYRDFVIKTGHREPGLWKDGYDPIWDRLPIARIALSDAVAYAEWVGKRLPTLFEWQRAARGTDGRLYPWGNDLGETDRARIRLDVPLGRSNAEQLAAMAPVDSYPEGRGPQGLFHTLGNVWEWTETMSAEVVDGELVLQPRHHVIAGACSGNKFQDVDLATCALTFFDHFVVQGGFRCAKSEEP
jgi:formylglycine-generating enzyme required for sulfatase activity